MFRALVLSIGLLTVPTLEGRAHDMWGLANPVLNDPELQVGDDFAAAAGHQPTGSRPRYILERALLWAPGARLRACFLNGDAGDRSKASQAIEDLRLRQRSVNIGIEFTGDCQNNTPEEIRISFNHGCCSAYVGRTALHPKLRGGPTVFLRSRLPDYIIQHEFLHALGVHHEHQNPEGANCYEQLIDVASYARSNGWDIATVSANLQIFGRNQRKFVWSDDRDRTSITHYHIPSSFLKGGNANPCFAGVNTRLSEGDYTGLRVAYPSDAGTGAARREAVASLTGVSLPPRLTSFLQAVPLE